MAGSLRRWVVPTLIYVVLTIALTWPLAARWTTDLPGGVHKDGLEDAYQNVWNFWWTYQSVSSFLNPLITDRLFYPERPNLYYHTLSPINTLLALPITAYWGPIAAFNAVSLASFFFGALGAWRLAYDRCGSSATALLAGIIYAWSPFHMAALVEDGQLQIVALHWLPWYVLFLLRAFEHGRRRDLLLAGLFLTLTAWTDWYYTLFLALFTVAYAFWRFVARASHWAARCGVLRRLLVVGVIGVLGAAPLLVPMVIESARADYMYLYPSNDPERLSADLLAYWLPARLQTWWGAAPWDWGVSVGVNRRLYLGFVALVLAFVGIRRQPAARRWGLVALVFAILSLGPTLRVADVVTGIPLPYRLIGNLPIIRLSREPDRFDVLVTLGLALAAAYGMREFLLQRRLSARVVLTALLGTALVFDYLAAPLVTRQPQVPAFLATLPHSDDGALIEYPFHADMPYRDAERMLFQTVHGRPISGGYHARLYPQPQLGLPVLRDLAAGYIASDIVVEPGGWAAALSTLGYRYIIGYKQQPLGPQNLSFSQAQRFRALVQAGLGVRDPDYEDDWLIVYRVPDAQPAPLVQFRTGWGAVEQGESGQRYRWLGSQAEMGLYVAVAGSYQLSWSAMPADDERTLLITRGAGQMRVSIGGGERRYHVILPLSVGATVFGFHVVEPPTSGDILMRNGDTRPISVRFRHFVLMPVG